MNFDMLDLLSGIRFSPEMLHWPSPVQGLVLGIDSFKKLINSLKCNLICVGFFIHELLEEAKRKTPQNKLACPLPSSK